MILWTAPAVPPILSQSDVPGYVLVAVDALRDALFLGMDRFLIDIYKEPLSNRAKLVDKRFNSLVQEMSAEDVMSTTTQP